LVVVERLAELVVSERNRRWSMARGGVETGQGHYPAIVVLHVGLLGGALAEVHLLERSVEPWFGWTMAAVVVAAQVLRWWCVRTLGRQWNLRVIVVPGLDRVASGPYANLRHPNYLAVVLEGAALPLAGGAWITATLFTILNLPLLWWRITVEERALSALDPAPQ
jgi:methyltransferase